MKFPSISIRKPNPTTIVEMTDNEKTLFDLVQPYTMTNTVRLWSLYSALKYLNNNEIAGDIVECGVWKGGNLILSGMVEKHKPEPSYDKRQIIGYDTFSGMTMPNSNEKKIGSKNLAINKWKATNKGKYVDWCYASLKEVSENYSNVVGTDNLRLIKGAVEDTLQVKRSLPERIALLRIDTDFYESVLISLQVLAPRVVNNGIIIIDDYGSWSGCKKAVDEYFGPNVFLQRVDNGSRLIINHKINNVSF